MITFQTTFAINQITEISDYQTVNIGAKIISQGDESSINVRGKSLNKVDYIIADKFASIKLVVWEKNINVAVNKTYLFSDISVRTFNDVKYLSTTKYTTVKEIDNLTETADVTASIQNYGKTITGTVVAVNLIKFKTCIFCNMKIQSNDEDTAIKCSNCKMTALATQLGQSTLSKIAISELGDDSVVTYTALDSALNTFLASIKQPNITTFSEVQLLKLFASYKTLKFTVSPKDKLVSDILIQP